MKNIFILLLMMCMTTGIYAQEKFTVDNLKYKILASDMVSLIGGETMITLTIPEQVTHEGKTYTVFNIEDNAFKGRNDLFYLNIPTSVKSIGEYAFAECDNLQSVHMAENSVESIKSYAFYICENLVQINLPNSLKSIGDRAFVRCSMLTTITLPNSLISIGGYAFMNTPLGLIISKIENPQSVPLPPYNTIIHDAFYMTLLGRNTYRDCVLQVPHGTLEKYKSAAVWKEFKNIIEMEATAIENITTAKNEKNVWYSLQGVRMNNKPTEKGVYIKNGKKVIIK